MKRGPVVWIPAVGRKVALARIWKQSLECLGGSLLGSDVDDHCSARGDTHCFIKSPRADAVEFESWVATTVEKYQVDWIVPVRESEFTIWSGWSGSIPRLLSKPEILNSWSSKSEAARWLHASTLPTPEILGADELESNVGKVIIKPNRGSGSQGIEIVDVMEVIKRQEIPRDFIIQRFVKGAEYTINLYFDPGGVCQAIIPHIRLAVEQGEVTFGRTVDDADLIALGERFAIATAGRCRGPINFQVIRDDTSGIALITDINPRFGGGYPLTHAAGGRFVDWILKQYITAVEQIDFRWKAGVALDRRGALLNKPFITGS